MEGAMIARGLLLTTLVATNLLVGRPFDSVFNSSVAAGSTERDPADRIRPAIQTTESKDSAATRPVSAIPFKESPPGKLPYNASEVVFLGDSRFLFCDNNVSDSLFEMRFTSQGELGPLIRHPIRGVQPEAIDDLECMTMAEFEGKRFLFVSSSLGLKTRNRKAEDLALRGKLSPARESFIRIQIGADGQPEAEIIPSFRSWLIQHAAILGDSPRHLPDDFGLNIEGLGWDPVNQALAFGLRSPVKDGKPIVLRVRVKNLNGIWNLSNLEMLPPVTLAIENADGKFGVRTIEYDPSRKAFLVLLGNAVSKVKAPFLLYTWDGNDDGRVERVKGLTFDPAMRPEGIAYGTIGGRAAIMLVDDRGGYQFLWNDDPRLK
jgi:hypothetical protein